MLIDALRSDYVFNKNSSYRLKIIEKFEKENRLFSIQIKVHSPTVTLPRIKVNFNLILKLIKINSILI